MFKIGIDVGSTFTKYCILDEDDQIVKLFSEKSPVHQIEYFEKKLADVESEYQTNRIAACGYGRKNVSVGKKINELIALAKGSESVAPDMSVILDIGGQDTKIIVQHNGKLEKFFINDKCAAGSGRFLSNVCNMLNIELKDINLLPISDVKLKLSSVCAVYAQSEIVELIANNVHEDIIISSVVEQILFQSKSIFDKVECKSVLLSGGMTRINGIKSYAESVLGKKCIIKENNAFLSALGCALSA